jgi:hypothetical protein
LYEFSFGGILPGISSVELDFLRSCLVIDGTARKSAAELMEHKYFDRQFKEDFELEFASLL